MVYLILIKWLLLVLLFLVQFLRIRYVFAKCGMFSRKTGGLGGYAAYAFGKSGSFIANFSYGLSLVIANLTIAISIVGYAVVLFDVQLTPLEVGLASIFVIWMCSLPNIGGARFIGSLAHLSSYGILIPILILIVMGWSGFSVDRYVAGWNPQNMRKDVRTSVLRRV